MPEVTAAKGSSAVEMAPPDLATVPSKPLASEHEMIVEKACKKLNRLMLPFALVFSIIASLDRANLSFASLCMSRELGFTAMDYGLGSAIFFISYSLCQIPSNVIFIYAGGPRMLGLIAVSWGLVAGSMAAVNSSGGFLAVRFLLGVAEAGTVPGIWAYLSSMYPASHLTLPTTFYMAGITLAQALGAPLAAGLLNLHGAADLSGWRWLFIVEGAPAIVLGVGIWMLLPASVADCKLLSPLEQAHLQAAVDGTIPPGTSLNPSSRAPRPSVTAVPAGDLSSRDSTSDGDSSRSCDADSISSSGSPRSTSLAAAVTAGQHNSQHVVAAGIQHSRADGTPSLKQLLGDLCVAAKCRVVWCSSGWRCLYLLTLNGLIFWVPLIVHSLLTTGNSSLHSELHSEGLGETSDTRILLLAAVPYVAGVVTHVMNAMHSHSVDERRYHIVVPWFLGALLLLMLPVAWQHQQDELSYALLVLASMGIMGCDGIDVSWIISLMDGLTPSQSALAMALINMNGNFGGFVGNFIIGALKQATGNYFGAVWMLGAIMLLAAGLVAVFPQAWATQRAKPNDALGNEDDGDDNSWSGHQGAKGAAVCKAVDLKGAGANKCAKDACIGA